MPRFRTPFLLSCFLLSSAVLLLAACEPAPSYEGVGDGGPEAEAASGEPTFQEAFAAPIENAFGADAWRSKEAVETGIQVSFGGNELIDGKMLFTPDTGRSRLELADGTVAVFDGRQAWVSPADAELSGARFHLLTWPYFLAVPAKLRDPGARLEELAPKRLGEADYDAARLTFGPGVGDAPDDWYVLYRKPDTGRLAAMAYIVTYGNTLEKAEAEPHAITYEELREVGGVEIPHRWRFWLWSEGKGIHGDPIGEVKLSDVRFVTPAADAFDKPEDAREDALPADEADSAGSEG